MGNNNNRFGPVSNEQPDYWQRGYATRDANLLDGHFDHRARGNRSINGQDSSINAYAIPRGMKVKLRENSEGGIPKIDGGALVWDDNYVKAQSRLLQNGQMPNLPDPYQGQRPDGVQEVDIGNIMAQRMMNSRGPSNNTGYQKLAPAPQQQMQHGPTPGQAMNSHQYQQSGVGMCQLQEGHTFFQSLSVQGFGTTMPLAKTGGQIKGIQGRQFQMEGVHECYVVDGLQTIDLSNIEPQRKRTLVRVTAPLLGTFLVPQEAIIQEGGQAPGRQLLIDTNQSHQLQGRQQWINQQQQAQQQQLIHTQQMQGRSQQQQQQYQQQYREQQMQQQAPRQQVNPSSIQQQSMDLLRRRGILKG